MNRNYKIVLLAIPAVMGAIFVLISIQPTSQMGQIDSLEIPFWFKDNMKWWAYDKTTDDRATDALLWYGVNKKIKISVVDEPTQIPISLKQGARLWIDGKITDDYFFDALQADLQNGSLKFSSNTNFNINDYAETSLVGNSPLFRAFVYEKDIDIQNGKTTRLDTQFEKISNQTENYAKISDTEGKSVVILPLFTSTAYKKSGFYDYYHGVCNEKCLTRELAYGEIYRYTGSANAIKVLWLLGYDTVTDMDVDMNPEILSNYDKVIVLHNEYVTQREFDAITGHPHVLYLYPNALYAKVDSDYENNEITLVRGHGYPSKDIANGFDWEFDNSEFEQDSECKNWEFSEIKNGKMLNCYPKDIIYSNLDLLKAIKDF